MNAAINLGLMSAGEVYGGVEQFIYTYAVHLLEQTDVRPVVILFHRGVLYRKLKEFGVETFVVPTAFKYDPVAIWRAARVLRANKLDLLHVHGYKATIIGGLAARWAGIKVIKTEHGALEPMTGVAAMKMAVNDAIDRWMTRRAVDDVVYITSDLLKKKNLTGRSRAATVIHSGIPNAANGRSPRSLSADHFNMGIVGRVCAVKGHQVLIRALALAANAPSVRLHVIGDGPLLADVRRQTIAAGLRERVEFHGFKTNVQELMGGLDCLVMPSYAEGLPFTLLEAMHTGLPVVASNVGGMKEILTHEETALLFDAGDAAALASAIDRLASDTSLRKRLGDNAKRTAVESFGIGRMSGGYIGLYEKLLRPAFLREKSAWLTWEHHRRTTELGKAFRLRVDEIKRSRTPLLKVLLPVLETARTLLFGDFRLVVVQSPSLVLTTIAAVLKPLKGYRLVQDLHSYFAWHFERPRGARQRLYRLLSAFCIRRSDVTIVTNEPLKRLIDSAGGCGFVLQDRLPNLGNPPRRPLAGAFNVVFVCTYSGDEPLEDVFAAARSLPADVAIYVTGRPPKNRKIQNVPANVILTGFLSEEKYAELLASADALMTLTTRENTLLCGAYEGISLGKPLVMSDKKALRDYFRKGVVYVENDAASLAAGVLAMRAGHARYVEEMEKFSVELKEEWAERFSELSTVLDKFSGEKR